MAQPCGSAAVFGRDNVITAEAVKISAISEANMDLEPIQTPEVFDLMRVETKLLSQLEKICRDIVNQEEQLRLNKQYRDSLYYWLRSQGIKVPLERLSEISGQPPSTISGITRIEAKNPSRRPSLKEILLVEPDPVEESYVPPREAE